MGLLVLNVDHLPVHLLGPYGNTSVPTPTLNSWAARGLTADAVFQNGIGDSTPATSSLAAFRRRADLCLSPGNEGRSVWPWCPTEPDDDSIESLVPTCSASRLAKTWEATSVAKYLERALSKWTEAILPSDAMVWLDLPLFSGPWDAPLAWRHYLAGDDDPEVYTDLEPPYLVLPSAGFGGLFIDDSVDPDLRLSYEHAAGAMIMLLDHACEWLHACVAAMPQGRETSILLTAESGYSLGEHFGIGSFPDRTWVEEAHVPMILFMGAAGLYPARIPSIMSQQQCLNLWVSETSQRPALLNRLEATSDYDRIVEQSLSHWSKLTSERFDGCGALREPTNDRGEIHDLVPKYAVISRSPNQIAIRTQTWSFVWKVRQAPHLFVRPDDRFEQNDVASRCPELVANIQWYLPELLAYFSNERRVCFPEFLLETWHQACALLSQEGRAPDQATWEQRLATQPNGSLLTRAELPELLWAEVT